MSKTALRVGKAFFEGESLKVNNTETDGNSVFLFGNEIIYRSEETGDIYWTMAGWPTITTKDRLNCILDLGLFQRDFVIFDRTGKEIEVDKWYLL